MSEMKNIDNGGPAFPHPNGANDATVQVSYLGMSLRDWFAGQVMAALIQRPDNNAELHVLARISYQAADAMIAARKAGAA